jgi:hypothetical protein
MDDTSWRHPLGSRWLADFLKRGFPNSEQAVVLMDEILRIQPIVRDFTATTLVAIPNVFGRLIYIASLRDLSSGRYEHSGLAALYPAEAVQEALKFCHQEIFSRVLEMPLAVQEKDFSECLEGMPGSLAATVAHWRQLEAYRILPPEDAPDYLRELFFSNLRVLLEILDSQHSTIRSGV